MEEMEGSASVEEGKLSWKVGRGHAAEDAGGQEGQEIASQEG